MRNACLHRLGSPESRVLKVNARECARQQIACAHDHAHADHMKPEAVVAFGRDEYAEADDCHNERAQQRDIGRLENPDDIPGLFVQLKDERGHKQAHHSNVGNCAEADQDTHKIAPDAVLMTDDTILPHTSALVGTGAPQAGKVSATRLTVAVSHPVAAGGRGHVKYGQQCGHVNCGYEAQFKLAKFGHEHHFASFFNSFLFC